MEKMKWSDRSDYYVHFQGSTIVNSERPCYICFTREELSRMRDAIDETIKAYDRIGFSSDSVINEWNENLEKSFLQKAERRSKQESRKTKASQDYLYLIHDTIQNTLKIGISRNPKNRFRNIQLATSNKLVMLYALKGKAHLEKELHKEFAEIRLASEWFKYDERIIERYKGL